MLQQFRKGDPFLYLDLWSFSLKMVELNGGFCTGYFSNAEATSSTLDSKGWLRTGDLCYIDEDGFIFVVDRLKELIKYKGYQVHTMFSYLLFFF